MKLGFWPIGIKDLRRIIPAAGCAVAGFLLAALLFGAPWHLPPNWGDIPTWLATFAAIAAGLVAYRVYQVEAQRDRLAEEERKGAQAAKIAAWYGSQSHTVTTRIGNSVQTYPAMKPKWGAFLRNASDLPVYDVLVKFHFPGTDAKAASGNDNVQSIVKMVLPPSDAPVHLEVDELTLRFFSEDSRADAFHRVEIEFTDAQGIRWHRDVKGRLKGIATTGTAGAVDGRTGLAKSSL